MSETPRRRRPLVLLSAATSIDGYINDTSDERLLLSNDEDFDRVDAVRARADAILVGAGTVRADNPRLLVRSDDRRKKRVEAGKPASPIKVTVSASGDLDPGARFFTAGDNDKIVYTVRSNQERLAHALSGLATVAATGRTIELEDVLADLADRGVDRLMVEGGAHIHTEFLTDGLVDQLDLVVAPFFIGAPAAPNFADAGKYPFNPDNPLRLTETRQMDNVVLLRYRTRLDGDDVSEAW